MRVVLDSTFLIDLIAGVPEAVDYQRRLFEDGDEPVVNEIVVCEVRAGLRDADVRDLEVLLEPMEFVQAGPASALEAGAWRRQAHERGRHLSLADALIASAAVSSGAAVVTRNVKDFVLTPVRIETY